MSRPFTPLVVSANVKSCLAWVSSLSAYAGSVGRKTIEEAAIAAAVSAATSVPGHEEVILYTGACALGLYRLGGAPVGVVLAAVATWTYRTFGSGWALTK